MLGFTNFWEFVPAPLQTFIFPAALCAYVYYMFREKRSQQNNLEQRWADERSSSIREDNDRQAARIASLETSISELREKYEATIERLRRDVERGWDLARAWCAVAHDLRHWINNKLMLVPEDKRPEPLEPLPGIERRPGVPADQFPSRFLAE